MIHACVDCALLQRIKYDLQTRNDQLRWVLRVVLCYLLPVCLRASVSSLSNRHMKCVRTCREVHVKLIMKWDIMPIMGLLKSG